jgi:hypothetical protein
VNLAAEFPQRGDSDRLGLPGMWNKDSVGGRNRSSLNSLLVGVFSWTGLAGLILTYNDDQFAYVSAFYIIHTPYMILQYSVG